MGLTKAQKAAKKAWTTRKKNQRRSHKGGSGKGRKPRQAVGFKRIKKGPRKGDVFPVLTPGQKAWQTRRKRGKAAEVRQLNGHDHYEHQWLIPSRTTKGKFYKVSVTENGVWLCDCPAWKFQKGPIKDRSPCSHIEEARRILMRQMTDKKKDRPTPRRSERDLSSSEL